MRCWEHAAYAISLIDYTQMMLNETERKYEPVTIQMCNEENPLRSMKSCLMALEDRAKMLEATAMYMTSKNHWNKVEPEDTIGGLSGYVDNLMRQSGRILSVAGSTSERRRRSLKNVETTLRRSKRDIPGNPCMRGEPKRTTILFGLDAETGEVLELFQNPELHMYQTFFTRTCYVRKFFSFNCDETFVVYMASVFENDTFNVISRPVKVPTGCALSVG
ncbi:unnamed protein product [Clavelina lepadiformis]|uniref:Uncharacterized protein n=1 Tax=Clavelina lepadiformis TaxID=159417 RepID=A0ABP0F7R5_CLALP